MARKLRQPKAQLLQDLEDFNLHLRKIPPDTAVAHLGPTNSGKTHDALQFLASRTTGVFASPLRQLAYEAYEKLSVLAPGRVGLRTGEEKINPDAPLMCVTTELVPPSGDTLVVDEVHWVTDPDRGWAFTRALACTDYSHYRLIGSVESRPVLEAAFADAPGGLRVVEHDRLGGLSFAGAIDLADVPRQSLIVTFSRASCHHLAGRLSRETMLKVSALYGALPPLCRRSQIDQFIKGDLDVLVCTDVIGHGINLPAANVIFAETTKFDGVARRPLATWEAAQIAGRAGRFQQHRDGSVYALKNLPGFSADIDLLKKAVEAAKGTRAARKEITFCSLRPQLNDLDAADSSKLPRALVHWQAFASLACRDKPWLQVCDMSMAAERATWLYRMWPEASLEELWSVTELPVDDPDILRATVKALKGSSNSLAQAIPVTLQGLNNCSLRTAEDVCQRARALRVVVNRFGSLGGVTAATAAEWESAASARCDKILQSTLRADTSGRCADCGDPTAPWFEYCDDCFRSFSRY